MPIDFETQTLSAALADGGFRADEPAFFSWLGVIVYLTRPAVMSTLESVAAFAPGSEIVFSYSLPPHLPSIAERSARAMRALRMAEIGEPWKTYLDPAPIGGHVPTQLM